MRWEDLPESQNVEDRRGEDGGGGGGFGRGGGGFPGGAGGLGIGTILVLGLIGYATGIDPSMLIGMADQFSRQQPQVQQTQPGQPPARPARRRRTRPDDSSLASSASTEATWKDVFARSNRTYRAPVLVLYSRQTHANCGGNAMAAMGPFYCPADKKIYLDTSFFEHDRDALPRLRRRQRVLPLRAGLCDRARSRASRAERARHPRRTRSARSRRPAAGRRKRTASRCASSCRPTASPASGPTRAQERLAPGDIEAALRTASAIGDDTLQRRSQGQVVPDSLHPRHLRAAPALVLHRLQAGHGR